MAYLVNIACVSGLGAFGFRCYLIKCRRHHHPCATFATCKEQPVEKAREHNIWSISHFHSLALKTQHTHK